MNSEVRPVVSIWSISYNHAPYIKECLDSLLNQKTNFPYEIVIGDDASTDGTQEIINDYVKKYPDKVKAVLHRENIGVIENSIGSVVPLLKGKYVAICEGDDFWGDPNKLQKQVDFLENNERYVACGHDSMVIDRNGVLVAKSKLLDISKRDCSNLQLQRGFWVLTNAVCFRNVLGELPPEIKQVSNVDAFLFSWLGRFGDYKYMTDINSSFYRIHNSGVWSNLDHSSKKETVGSTYLILSNYYSRVGNNKLARFYSGNWQNYKTKVYGSIRKLKGKGNFYKRFWLNINVIYINFRELEWKEFKNKVGSSWK